MGLNKSQNILLVQRSVLSTDVGCQANSIVGAFVEANVILKSETTPFNERILTQKITNLFNVKKKLAANNNGLMRADAYKVKQ